MIHYTTVKTTMFNGVSHQVLVCGNLTTNLSCYAGILTKIIKAGCLKIIIYLITQTKNLSLLCNHENSSVGRA